MPDYQPRAVRFAKRILLPVVALIALPVAAELAPATEREIAHLLEFVKTSTCQIERNGKIYPSAKGVSHIRKKFDYFESRISTAEEFIEYSATRSTMSGKDYQVHCEGMAVQRSQDWLLQELARFRQQANG